jgi:hypothetical protein
MMKTEPPDHLARQSYGSSYVKNTGWSLKYEQSVRNLKTDVTLEMLRY